MSTPQPRRAVVFAYHNVGVRCLRVLLARGAELGLDVALVVTHEDNPQENIWFDSVASVAAEYGIPAITPDDPKDPALMQAVAQARPDYIFSFYYRHMLPVPLLELAPLGAYNMHGSLLPRYRGRVPVNWAVLHGEQECGATLHEMAAKPDAGAILAQTAVPILPDDTAGQVFDKVTVAAEQTLWQALPALLDGSIARQPNRLEAGSYFGGRKPEDGRIDWTQPAQQVYNLIRAVAPPYPGAFTELGEHRFIVARARLARPGSAAAAAAAGLPGGLQVSDNMLFGVCGDGRAIVIHSLLYVRRPRPDGQPGSAPGSLPREIGPAEFAGLVHP
jgi:methionyl-tRNA formyltransferase